jgi:PAS domain S-box-containing protein
MSDQPAAVPAETTTGSTRPLVTASRLDSLHRRRRLASWGVYLALAMLAGVALATFVSIHGFVERARRVEHTHTVRLEIEQIRTDYGKARMYWRMFLLGGDPEHERGFAHARSSLEFRLDSLAGLTADNAAQQTRLRRLANLVRTDLDALQESIQGRRADRFPTPEALIAEISARSLHFEELESVALEMIDAETALLEQRAAETAASGFRTTALIAAGSTAAGTLLLVAFFVLRREIRQRRLAELEAQQAAREIEDLYNHAPCAYHSLDATGTYVRVNDTELSWLGYTREEMLGRMRFTDILAPESLQRFAESFPRFKATGRVEDLEFELVGKNGGRIPVSLSATAVYDGRGNYLMSRSSMFDLTQRRKAEAERDRFFSLAIDMLCIAGLDGYFKRLNPAFSETLGYSARELLERPMLDFVHEEDRPATLAEMEKLRHGVPTIQFENRYRCRDGSWKWLSWKVQPFPGEGLLYATARDVTHRRKTEERIRALNRSLEARAAELEETNRELDSFSYSVSHDLRGPLRAIDGFSRMLEEDFNERLDDEGRRLIQVIRDNSQKMAALIDDLLAFSRLGRKPIARGPVDMNALVNGLLVQLREQTGLDPEVVVSDLGTAYCDETLLRQVWTNLLSNAFKFTSGRSDARIEVGLLPPDADFSTWYVKDNGAGFDMKYADKLFGVFQRLHSESEFAGTGVGLAIVHRVVARHGGRVWAEAQVGKGATFFFSLPMEVPDGGA